MLLAHLEQAYHRAFAGDVGVGSDRPAGGGSGRGGRRPVRPDAGARTCRRLGRLVDRSVRGGERRVPAGHHLAKEDGRVYFQSLSLAGMALTLAVEGRIEEARPPSTKPGSSIPTGGRA